MSYHALRKIYPRYIDRVDEVFSSFEVIEDKTIDKVEKEYKSEEFSFSMKYPERWIELEQEKPNMPVPL